jgi:acetate kinase
MRVLTVNAGSSSLKVSLVADGRSVRPYGSLDAALADHAPDAVGHRVVHGGPRTAPALVERPAPSSATRPPACASADT